MFHKGIEFSVTPIEPGLWRWRFNIDGTVKSGRVKANLRLLAERRARMLIDRALRQLTLTSQLQAAE